MLELRLRSRTAGLLPRASSTTSARPLSHSNSPLEGVWAGLAEGLEQFTLTALSIVRRRTFAPAAALPAGPRDHPDHPGSLGQLAAGRLD